MIFNSIQPSISLRWNRIPQLLRLGRKHRTAGRKSWNQYATFWDKYRQTAIPADIELLRTPYSRNNGKPSKAKRCIEKSKNKGRDASKESELEQTFSNCKNNLSRATLLAHPNQNRTEFILTIVTSEIVEVTVLQLQKG